MKITEHPYTHTLTPSNVFLVDGEAGTHIITAQDAVNGLLGLGGTSAIANTLNLSELVAGTVGDVNSEDNILVGTSAGNKKYPLSEALYALVDGAAITNDARVALKRTIFRGKSLGSVVTDEQFTAINDRTYHDMFLGDYWTIGSRIWRIVDFDYWRGYGDTLNDIGHVVIMPDQALYKDRMNSTDTTVGAYVGSEMYGSGLNNAKTIIRGAFGNEHLYNHREFLSNAVTNGYESAGIWTDSDIELPNESMMYGQYHFRNITNGTNIPNNNNIVKGQLALFQILPLFINPRRQNQWLRDVISPSWFAGIYAMGYSAYSHAASVSYGVRPVFGIKD